MATDRIAKLYDGLTAKEKALLVFTHLSKQNKAEADRIAATVPTKTYRMMDCEHLDWFEGLRKLAMFFALEYWRYTAHIHAVHGALLYLYRARGPEADEMVDPVLEGWKRWESHLLSLEAALKVVCDKRGLDEETVRVFASIEETFHSFGIGEVDPKLMEEMATDFEKLLPSEK